MGLDMFAIATKEKISSQVDFEVTPEEQFNFHYWSLHADLHAWMERLYHEKGGTAGDEETFTVLLEEADLDRLFEDVNSYELPDADGQYDGNSTGQEVADDFWFIGKARYLLRDGKSVYYTVQF